MVPHTPYIFTLPIHTHLHAWALLDCRHFPPKISREYAGTTWKGRGTQGTAPIERSNSRTRINACARDSHVEGFTIDVCATMCANIYAWDSHVGDFSLDEPIQCEYVWVRQSRGRFQSRWTNTVRIYMSETVTCGIWHYGRIIMCAYIWDCDNTPIDVALCVRMYSIVIMSFTHVLECVRIYIYIYYIYIHIHTNVWVCV